MDKIVYGHRVDVTPQLRYQHIMEIVQEAYNEFKRAQRRGKTLGTNKKLQLKMATERWKKISNNHENLIKQSLKRKRPIQKSLNELL
jgi:predicted transcriptional regulator